MWFLYNQNFRWYTKHKSSSSTIDLSLNIFFWLYQWLIQQIFVASPITNNKTRMNSPHQKWSKGPKEMKKFCSKLSKPQWRVTVPNLQPPALFRQSSGKEKEKTASSSSTGSYDLEAAAKEYDRSRSVVVLQTVDSSDSETDPECYEDATMSEKLSSPECQDDSGIYAEPQHSQRLSSSKVLDEFNSR